MKVSKSSLSTGKYSKSELSRLYGLRTSTINNRIKKYERSDLMNTWIMIENQDEISCIKALQKEIEQLKTALIKKDLEQLANDSFLEVAAENWDIKMWPS